MKSSLSRRSASSARHLIRGIIASIVCTAVLVVLFALIISLFDISDSLIHLVNQLIKIISVGVGVSFAVSPGSERGLMRGALVGFVYMAAGVMVYALLTGQHLSFTAYLADILMGVATGGLFGLIRAKAAS